MSIYDVFSGGSKPFDKEQWAAQKQAQRKEAYQTFDHLLIDLDNGGNSAKRICPRYRQSCVNLLFSQPVIMRYIRCTRSTIARDCQQGCLDC